MPPDVRRNRFGSIINDCTTAPLIGTMVQKYNRISLKFNDLRFAYFGETVNKRNEMDIELISFIAMLEISFWQDFTATLILDYSEVGLSRDDKCIHR